MKALVLSDSHGHALRLQKVLRAETDCRLVFFLGDGLRDLEKVKADFSEKKFVCVTGNNDWDAAGSYDDFAYQYVEGNTVIATHGHRIAVRYTLQDLAAKAQAVRANVALYGHTHIPAQQTVGGVLCVNPGALCNGQYAVLELAKDGVGVSFRHTE